MAINTEMRVDGIAEYKNAMSQARQSVKTLDDELKKSEAQYKATWDKETYMADKTRILQKQLQEQQRAAKAAENALKQMTAQGVDPSSTAYQKMDTVLHFTRDTGHHVTLKQVFHGNLRTKEIKEDEF